jgi:hypothetical protein
MEVDIMQKGKTLWQMWTEHDEPKHIEFYNPMKARIGSIVTIDDVDLSKLDLVVDTIEEFTREIGGQEFKFTDYLLKDRKGGEVIRLRINPAGPNVAGVPHNVIVLRLDDEFGYSDDFLAVVNDQSKKLKVTDEKAKTADDYWRINDVSGSYKCEVSIINAVGEDGSADEKSVSKASIEYWDYWRETKDEAGVTFRQFVFVNMNAANGWFQIWKGEEINPQKIVVI